MKRSNPVEVMMNAIYQLLPHKIGGFYIVALLSNAAAVQFKSMSKAFCLEWMEDNQPKPRAG